MVSTIQQTAFRFTDEDRAMIDALQARLGVTRTDVIRLALRRLAELEGINVKAKSKRTKSKPKR